MAATASAVIRSHGGTGTVTTSDAGDLQRLIDASNDTGTRASASVQVL